MFYACKNRNEKPVLSPHCDSTGKVNPIPVDQYPNQNFNYGFNGLIANDLTLLERANSLAECELIAQRLNQYKAENPATDGMSDADIVKLIKPRLYQSPSELQRFIDYYYDNHVEPSLQASKTAQTETTVDPSPAADE